MKNAMIHRLGFCVCLWMLGSTSPAAGQDRLLENNDCLYSVEGNCVPRRTTYGYYQTHWRTWPFGEAPRVPKLKKKHRRAPNGSTALPDAEVPRVKDESSLNPNLSNKPEDLVPEGAVPSSQYETDRQTDPFRDDMSVPRTGVPDFDMPDVEAPLEDDLNIPPAASSGAIRRARSGISQARPMRTAPTSTAPAGFRNPLRKVSAQNQVILPHLMQTSPSTRSVSYAVPIHETRSLPKPLEPATANLNPLRAR